MTELRNEKQRQPAQNRENANIMRIKLNLRGLQKAPHEVNITRCASFVYVYVYERR